MGVGVPGEAVSTWCVNVCEYVHLYLHVFVFREVRGHPLGETVGNNNYCSIVAKLCLNCSSLPTGSRCQERKARSDCVMTVQRLV